jgi:hypothetical protein
MKTIPKKQLAQLEAVLKPGEHIVEVTTTIRWVTTKDLEEAAAELKEHTDKFQYEERLDGYVSAKLLTGL